MKKLLIIPLLLTGLSLFAQPSKEDIRKFRIRYYQEIKQYEYKDSSSNITFTGTWWFDRKGNDSIIYKRYDTLLASYVFGNGKVIQRVYKNMSGDEKERYVYEYKADGSYKVTFTDGDYGLKSYERYDKKDKILKSQSPDGNMITYKYDAKGKLLSAASDGKNNGIKLSKKYYYNTKGQLAKMDYKMDENISKTSYEYNAKGQVINQSEIGKASGSGFTRITVMNYNEKGLILTSRADKKDEDGGWEKINESFEYKYY